MRHRSSPLRLAAAQRAHSNEAAGRQRCCMLNENMLRLFPSRGRGSVRPPQRWRRLKWRFRPRIPERPPRFCVPAGRSQTASSQLFVNHALRCFERTRAMLRLPPRVEPSRCLRARRPCRDHAAHPRRDFLMVRPDAIEHACDYFPCTHAHIHRLRTWARFAAAHATQLRRLSFPLPHSDLCTAHY